ncbi:LTA synthase family protein [Streptococcus cameli]
MFKEKCKKFLQSRFGFILFLVSLFWIKTIFAYFVSFNLDFNKDLQGAYQMFIAAINPLPTGLLLIGAALYFKRSKTFYYTAIAIYVGLFIWMFSNLIYFREFTDYITISAMIASSSTSKGLFSTVLKMVSPWDILYFLDIFLLIFLRVKKWIPAKTPAVNKRASFAVTALSIMLLSVNLFLAELERPELLSRGFSNNYIVRALGFPAFFLYNANQTYSAHKDRSDATEADLKPVQEYVSEQYAAPNPEYFGIAKGRNVIYLHLESLQQFIIDYKLMVDETEYEVTPFLNSLYHSKETFAFSNFFHQVKAGKTSDSETLIENSLFGLNQGSFMVQYGGSNTQQAAPHILAQNGGYSSAVFHGNAGSFWNRNNTYKQWGYNYFFDQSYFSTPTKDNSFQYGLNDKVMFADAIPYLERMQQPFYTKFITVSNHYPYTTSLSGDEVGFPLAKTDDETINGYFATANYLDTSIKSFFDYLKATGLYENSIIVLYGDHYGISNSRNPDLAPLLGKDSETWTDYDNAMLQRVPYMIVVPGMNKGHIVNTYGGEVDALPTLEHLLGIESKQFLQVGQDLLSPDNKEIVSTRTNGSFITPKYTSYAGKLYYTETGDEITNPDEEILAEVELLRTAASTQLAMSDAIQTGDLIRFLKNDIPTVDATNFSYLNSLEAMIAIENKLGDKSTSLYSQNGNKTTQDLFQAPSYLELNGETDEAATVSSSSSETKKE